jgi:hypothetical protein
MPSALTFFAKELNEADGFDELMIQKKAFERIDGSTFIITHNNIQEYKEKFLTEKYKPLRPYFNTKIPYSFWSQLYVALRKKMSIEK